MTLRVFIANNITAQLTDADNVATQLTNQVNNQIRYHQLTWCNSILNLNGWLPQRLSKRQSLSTTTVLFRSTFTRTIILNLLITYLVVLGGLCIMRVIVPQACDTKVTTYPSPKSTLTLTSHLGQIATYGTGRWSVIRHKHNTCEVAGVLLVFIRARFLKRRLSLTQD